jgi:hypothetical protein
VIEVRARRRLNGIVWKNKSEVYILSNTDQQPAEANLYDEKKNALKSLTVEHQ